MAEEQSWSAGTWEGARRAHLRRALRRTVRERLEVMVELGETGRRLARLGRPEAVEARSPGKEAGASK